MSCKRKRKEETKRNEIDKDLFLLAEKIPKEYVRIELLSDIK
jgi:hypothetical protein